MELQLRRIKNPQDQENMYVNKKIGVSVPTKSLCPKVRGVLGDINTNTNIQSQSNVNVSKVAAACEIDKKIVSRRIVRSYRHVQSKVDTGLAIRDTIKPSSRPPLRREESTGSLAARAIASRVTLKDAQKNPIDAKILVKENVQPKKGIPEKNRLPIVKENANDVICFNKQSSVRESLRKLKLDENETAMKIERVVVQEYKKSTSELPKDVEDIDANDTNTALHSTHYSKDIYRYLADLEIKYSIVEDHLAKQVVVTEKMRALLIDWLIQVHIQFSLELETLHITVGIIDRYLQIVPDVKKSKLQLVGITAMFIASKFEEIYPPDIENFVSVTDNAYTKYEMIKCEQEMFTKLGCCLAWPIPLVFLRRFVKAARGTSQNHHLGKYFVDLCLVEYTMAHYRASELAAAAVCLSLYTLSKRKLTEIWTPTLAYYSQYTLEHIKPIMHKIAVIVTNVENAKCKAAYHKYTHVTLARVSTLPQLKDERMQELITALGQCI